MTIVAFLVVFALVLCLGWMVGKGLSRFAAGVNSFATTPLQYVLAWVMVPFVIGMIVGCVGLLVNVGGLLTPTWQELANIWWSLVFAALCGAAVWALLHLGGFGVEARSRLPENTVTHLDDTDWVPAAGGDAPGSGRVGTGT